MWWNSRLLEAVSKLTRCVSFEVALLDTDFTEQRGVCREVVR